MSATTSRCANDVYPATCCYCQEQATDLLVESGVDRLTNGEHVLQERRGGKLNSVELASGTCKLPGNELCYIVLDVHLKFRESERERDGKT